MARILLADDQRDVLEALRILLKSESYQTEGVTSLSGIFNALEKKEYSLLLMDLNYTRDTTSGEEGLSAIVKIQEIDPTLPIVVMTAWATIELAVEAMKRGARDFVTKPWDNQRLLTIVRTQIELASASAEVVEAEMAVARAADSVITNEVEARCNLDRINAAIATLIEVDEEVFGLGYLWMGGKPLNHSETLQAIFARLEPLRNAVAQMRPERPILSPPPEQTTARRLESYRTALTQNAGAQLKNIAKPVWEPPKPMSQNIILREREALRTRIAAAVG